VTEKKRIRWTSGCLYLSKNYIRYTDAEGRKNTQIFVPLFLTDSEKERKDNFQQNTSSKIATNNHTNRFFFIVL